MLGLPVGMFLSFLISGRVAQTYGWRAAFYVALAPGLVWDAARLYVDGSLSVVAVPEPGQWALLLAGLGVVGAVPRRRARRG